VVLAAGVRHPRPCSFLDSPVHRAEPACVRAAGGGSAARGCGRGPQGPAVEPSAGGSGTAGPESDRGPGDQGLGMLDETFVAPCMSAWRFVLFLAMPCQAVAYGTPVAQAPCGRSGWCGRGRVSRVRGPVDRWHRPALECRLLLTPVCGEGLEAPEGNVRHTRHPGHGSDAVITRVTPRSFQLPTLPRVLDSVCSASREGSWGWFFSRATETPAVRMSPGPTAALPRSGGVWPRPKDSFSPRCSDQLLHQHIEDAAG
jgi:hypothetical protein